MLDGDDRIWPKLLQRVCAESLATIWFEPIADLARAVAVGYRARPRFPLVGADYTAWRQAAERHGYRSRFAASTLTAILDRRDALPADAFLAVELDAAALTSDGVLSVLRRAGDLSAVVFELTRFEQDRDHRQLMNAVNVARAHGARVSLRATGSGHADPLQLADAAPQFVRVSPGLVAGLDQHPRRAAALAALGSLAGALDAWLVADGVAGEQELEVLRALGVPLVQGPLIGGERELMLGLEPAVRELLRAEREQRSGPLGRVRGATRQDAVLQAVARAA
jgi:EAL domain-containing protein (putative c-di-GMP-specific phosphodiesterase class I)